GRSEPGEPFSIIAFVPDPTRRQEVAAIPSNVGDSMVAPAVPVRSRSFSLDMMMDGGMMGGGMMANGMMGAMGINGRPFDMERIDQRIALGSIEKWVVQSTM